MCPMDRFLSYLPVTGIRNWKYCSSKLEVLWLDLGGEKSAKTILLKTMKHTTLLNPVVINFEQVNNFCRLCTRIITETTQNVVSFLWQDFHCHRMLQRLCPTFPPGSQAPANTPPPLRVHPGGTTPCCRVTSSNEVAWLRDLSEKDRGQIVAKLTALCASADDILLGVISLLIRVFLVECCSFPEGRQ
jgi:hypothetical protein